MSTIFTTIWDLLVFAFTVFVFFAYLIALFSIITDLFRDQKLNGWFKALWLIFLIFFPFVTVLVYLIARGKGLSERSAKDAKVQQEHVDEYIRHVAGTQPAQEIAHAQELLSKGVITEEEFDQLKRKVLS